MMPFSKAVDDGNLFDLATLTLATGWSIDGNDLVCNGSTFSCWQDILTVGKSYDITYTVYSFVSGTVRAKAGGTNGAWTTLDFTRRETLLCTTSGIFYIDAGTAFYGRVKDVSIFEL